MTRRTPFGLLFCLVFLSFLLCICAVLPCAAETSDLVSDPTDFPARFYATRLSVHGADLSREPDALTLQFEKPSPGLSGVAPVSDEYVGQTACNVLRLTLANESACDEIVFSFVKSADGTTVTGSVPIQPYSDVTDYDIPLVDAASISEWTLTFSGVTGGRVRILSFVPLSVYRTDTEENNGTIDVCEYDPSIEMLTVSGTVRSGVLSANKGAELVIYRIPAGEDPTSWLELSHPIALATTPIANHFSFHISVYHFEDVCARYLVCIRTADGNVIFLTSAAAVRFLGGERNGTVSSSRTRFKGIGTTRYTDSFSVAPGTAIVEVRIDRLLNADETDFVISDRELITYVSRSYIRELDDEIRFYTESGCRVWLQFLVDAGAPAITCSPILFRTGDDVRYRALQAHLISEASELYLVTSFLCDRYSEASETPVAAIVVGDRADLAATYNNSGTLPLVSYVERYAEVLTVIANASAASIPDLQLIVPVSDRVPATGIRASERDGSYRSDLFLEGLGEILKDRFGARLQVIPMLVNDRVGYSRGENGDLQLYTDDTCFDAGHADAFGALLDKQPDPIGKKWIYAFLPSVDLPGDVAEAAYADGFYRLFFESDLLGCVISFSANERDGFDGQLEEMRRLIGTIDTADAPEGTAYALNVLGIDSWNERIPAWDPENIAVRRVDSVDPASSGDYRGTLTYWDFSKATGTLGWKGTYGYGILHLDATSRFGRSLTTELMLGEVDGDAYCGVDYCFARPLDVSTADALVFELGLESAGPGGGVYEVTVQGGNGNRTVIAGGVCDGERTLLNVDLSALSESGLQYLRIFVRRLDGKRENATLIIHTISFVSETRDGETLTAGVRPIIPQSGENEDRRELSTPAKLFLILIAGAQVVALSFVIRGKKKK